MIKRDFWLLFSFQNDITDTEQMLTLIEDCGIITSNIREEVVVTFITQKLNNIVTKSEVKELLDLEPTFQKRVEFIEETNEQNDIVKVTVYFDNEILVIFNELEDFYFKGTFLKVNMPYTSDYVYIVEDNNQKSQITEFVVN
jgi:hypothetical protein